MPYTGNPDSPRTIIQLHNEMLENDPCCGLTLSALRRLVRSGQIRSCKIGAKYLVTHGAVADFLAGRSSDVVTEITTPGIRRVDLRGTTK